MPIKMTALGGLPPAYSWQDPSLDVVDFVSYWTRTAASNAPNVFVIRSPKDIYACIVSFKCHYVPSLRRWPAPTSAECVARHSRQATKSARRTSQWKPEMTGLRNKCFLFFLSFERREKLIGKLFKS